MLFYYGIDEKDTVVKAIDQVNEFMKAECFTRSPEPVGAFRLGDKKRT